MNVGHTPEEQLAMLLREFEEIAPRRVTQTTVVYDRAELDAWRVRCGEALPSEPVDE